LHKTKLTEIHIHVDKVMIPADEFCARPSLAIDAPAELRISRCALCRTHAPPVRMKHNQTVIWSKRFIIGVYVLVVTL
jgi:hypothetical protein